MGGQLFTDFNVFIQAVADLATGLNPYPREGLFSPPWLFYLLFHSQGRYVSSSRCGDSTGVDDLFKNAG